ncbi:DUF1467 family protein [Sphingomonas sp. GlSt437]|uniref:DUF1467 family protein n=1 Tax=Sphingomonas sp. GlSt437 TaxID=3389970 RepID=UPI003A88BC40
MKIQSMIAIYFLIWVFCVFLVLPFGVRTADEAGAAKVPGQAESAPHVFDGRRIALRVTVLATAIFALFLLNYHFGWLQPEMLDFFGGNKPIE